MKKSIAATVLLIAVLLFSPGVSRATTFSFDLGYHFSQDSHGGILSFIYAHSITTWFEFGADIQYWTQFGEVETDSWEKTNPDDNTGTIHKYSDYNQRNAGFFGPVFRFPLTTRSDQFWLIVPTFGIGGEAYANREWTEELIDRPAASDTENVYNDVDKSGFGWYIRPGLTFALSWWRLSYEHFVSQEGAIQFSVTTGLDIYRLFTKVGRKGSVPVKESKPKSPY